MFVFFRCGARLNILLKDYKDKYSLNIPIICANNFGFMLALKVFNFNKTIFTVDIEYLKAFPLKQETVLHISKTKNNYIAIN